MSLIPAAVSPPDRGFRWFLKSQTRWSATVLVSGAAVLALLFIGSVVVIDSYGWTQTCPEGVPVVQCSQSEPLARGLGSREIGWIIWIVSVAGGLIATASVLTYRRMPNRPAREAVVSGGVLGVLGLLLALAFAWFRGTDLLLFARNFLNLRRIGDNIGLSASAIADDLGSILTLTATWGGVAALVAYAWVRLRHGNPRVVLWAGLIAGGLGAMWAVLSTAAVRSFALAAQNTLFLSAAGAGLGFGLGLVLALFALSKRSVVRAPARVYINFFRGTPLIWQISFFGIGIVPALRLPISMYTVAILVLGLNLAAYSAEVYRSGVQSLERGQMEASRSLGLSYGQSMRFVVVPQAVRRVIPPLLNEFVILIKDTALVSVLGLTLAQRELLGMGRSLYSQSFDATAWLGAAAGYLIITLPLIRVVTVVEKRMRSGLSSVTG
jgi:His/Glu/Gln/Arg/opine family amino acid ABC transporter permease subunit